MEVEEQGDLSGRTGRACGRSGGRGLGIHCKCCVLYWVRRFYLVKEVFCESEL